MPPWLSAGGRSYHATGRCQEDNWGSSQARSAASVTSASTTATGRWPYSGSATGAMNAWQTPSWPESKRSMSSGCTPSPPQKKDYLAARRRSIGRRASCRGRGYKTSHRPHQAAAIVPVASNLRPCWPRAARSRLVPTPDCARPAAIRPLPSRPHARRRRLRQIRSVRSHTNNGATEQPP